MRNALLIAAFVLAVSVHADDDDLDQRCTCTAAQRDWYRHHPHHNRFFGNVEPCCDGGFTCHCQDRVVSFRLSVMLQPPEESAPLQVAPGVRLIGASRSPYLLRDLIAQGKFGDQLGRSLLALVREPSELLVSDHEFRLLHQCDGYLYAVYSIAQQGCQKIAALGFQRQGVVTEVEKAVMWKINISHAFS